jgi:serine protease
MRMRLLFTAGLAALFVTAPAAAREDVRPITLRQSVAAAPLFAARPRPLPSFRMRWAREQSRRVLATTTTFRGGRAVVGLARAADAAAVAQAFGVSPVFLSAGLRALEVSGTQDALRALDAAVGSDPRLRYVEPLRERRTLHKRNDPLTTSVDPVSRMPYEWQFAHVGVDRALNADRGSPAILVGVIDTGFGNVPDLAGKVGRAWFFDGQATDAYDTLGHGTFVSSLVGSNNDDGRGMAGFCGACRLLVVKDLALSSFTVATGIRTLTDAGARVINMSFGGPGLSLAEADALNYAISKGVLPVASSGNDGGVVNYPAAFLQPSGGALGFGLAVGASDALDVAAPWSSHGDHLSLLAPGTFAGAPRCDAGVFGALPPVAALFDSDCGVKFSDTATGARYGYSDGTSFAAPEVAGVAALVWGARPDLLSYQVASILLQSAKRPAGSGWTADRGWGVLDAAAAVELATGKSTADAVRIGEPRFDARVEGGSSATATADVTYQDGASVLEGTATCTADVGGRSLAAKDQRFDNGSVRCTWDVPAAAGGGTLDAGVEVRDAESGAVGSRDFGADVLDVLEPRVQALRASARYGARVALRFRVTEETGEVRRMLRVYRRSKAIFSAWSELEADGPGSVEWKAPRRGVKGPFKFCVSASDRSGNDSDRSCARIVLR